MNKCIMWHRRDLRISDNAALFAALSSGHTVVPIFIFDENILTALHDKSDRRVTFIHDEVTQLSLQYAALGCHLHVLYGKPLECLQQLTTAHETHIVFTNKDYEPYALSRDNSVQLMLSSQGGKLHQFKDHVIFEQAEVTKDDGLPYTVYTPYSRKWKAKLTDESLKPYPCESHYDALHQSAPDATLPTLQDIGFEPTAYEKITVTPDQEILRNYHNTRDIPSIEGTSKLSMHLRFGTLSIRQLATTALAINEKYLNELIWRDFYQQILWHFPHVVSGSFKPLYDNIAWRNNEDEFQAWCTGNTGYPIVDAGMRQLNTTGWMHNRVRMIVASFLTKHLLIDWRWGEAYFAQKLNDFELASNNGGWQWAAGSGVDAAPYFRVFNPSLQTAKFDGQFLYIKKWVPEFESLNYRPVVDHAYARERCLATYKRALAKDTQSS
jgi:deoxyribodipyrimidine photo-lyase